MAKKKLTPKQKIEKRKERRKLFFIKWGAYLTILAGVLTTWAFPDMQISLATGEFDIAMVELQWYHGVAGMIASTVIYTIMEKNGDLAGKRLNVGRLARTAFLMGFFATEILSRFSI